MRRRGGGIVGLLLVGMLGAGVVACGQPLESEAGLVVEVDSPSLGRVDSFELRTVDGEILRFDTTDLEFHREFPAAHLAEHMAMAQAVRVTYRRDGDRRRPPRRRGLTPWSREAARPIPRGTGGRLAGTLLWPSPEAIRCGSWPPGPSRGTCAAQPRAPGRCAAQRCR